MALMVDHRAALEYLSQEGSADGQPARSFAALAQFLRLTPGYLLFSVSRLEHDTWLRRLYSTDAIRHPPGAIKDMAGTGFCGAVVHRRSHLLCRNAADLCAAFQDHAAIIADGVGCAINLCLRYDGRVVGSANFLGHPGAYDSQTLAALSGFAFPLALLVVHSPTATGS